MTQERLNKIVFVTMGMKTEDENSIISLRTALSKSFVFENVVLVIPQYSRKNRLKSLFS